MNGDHVTQVRSLLTRAAAEHARLVSVAPPELRESLPVDGQGVTAAIDHLDAVGGEALGQEVRTLLVEHPPPVATDEEVVPTLRATYAAQERAAVLIAASLDGR